MTASKQVLSFLSFSSSLMVCNEYRIQVTKTSHPNTIMLHALIPLRLLNTDDLEHMSLEEGSTLVERIISIVKGDIEPNPSVPAEWMMREVWDNLSSIDAELTDDMKEPAYLFWRSQVAAERLKPKTLKSYLHYREADIASAYVSLNYHISPTRSVN